MRDNRWLKKQLDFLLEKYFADLRIISPIEIKFGREARYRFGSIRLVKPRGLSRASFVLLRKSRPQKSLITITSMFAKESIPAKVVLYTIAHELCHYAHGFSSANRQLFRYPHHGGVVNRELESRRAEHLTRAFKSWLKEYRKKILTGRTML